VSDKLRGEIVDEAITVASTTIEEQEKRKHVCHDCSVHLGVYVRMALRTLKTDPVKPENIRHDFEAFKARNASVIGSDPEMHEAYVEEARAIERSATLKEFLNVPLKVGYCPTCKAAPGPSDTCKDAFHPPPLPTMRESMHFSDGAAMVAKASQPIMREIWAMALELAASLHESVDVHCDHEPPAGAGAMGAVIRYRDLIREAKKQPKYLQQALEKIASSISPFYVRCPPDMSKFKGMWCHCVEVEGDRSCPIHGVKDE
jgi:RNase P subunit RPR2